MSTSNLNIFVPSTGTPVHVSSAYASDFQIANNSTSPVWVGGDSSVSVSSGLLLNPGGATTWGGGQDLWAVAAKGTSGMVTCLFNASGSYTPGPTTIGISGTVPTAPGNYLEYLGGAVNAAIPSGSLAFSKYPITPLVFNMGSAFQGSIDTTGYASILIQVVYRYPSGITLDPANFLHVDVAQARATSGGILGSLTSKDSGEWLLGNLDITGGTGYQTYLLHIPVKNSIANISAYASGKAGLPAGVLASVLAFGSNQLIDSTQYANQSSDLVTGAPSGDMAYVQQNVIGTYEFPIETYNGDSQFHVASTDSIQHASTTIRGDLVEYSGGAITSFLGSVILPTGPTPGTSVTTATGTSCRPMALRLTIGGANNFSAVYLTQ